VCGKESVVALPTIQVEEPTVSMTFKVRRRGNSRGHLFAWTGVAWQPCTNVCLGCRVQAKTQYSRASRQEGQSKELFAGMCGNAHCVCCGVDVPPQVNTSPFAGKEGKFVTSRNIKDRLDR
jgi:hypothetical protein